MATEAEKFLRRQLANGPKRSTDVYEAAEAEGIPARNIDRARINLGVEARKHGFGAGSHSTIDLPREKPTADSGEIPWWPRYGTRCMTCGWEASLPKSAWPHMHTDPYNCDAWRYKGGVSNLNPNASPEPGDCMGQYDTEHLTRHNTITGQSEHITWAEVVDEWNQHWSHAAHWQIPQPKPRQATPPPA